LNELESVTNIGLIGCGQQGRLLATALRKVESASLVAVADVNEVAARRTLGDFGADEYYLDYHEMLSSNRLDAVMIATPHSLLKDISVDAAEAGKHVFVEKPMGTNRFQAEEIINSARKSGVGVMVGYCLRYAGVRTLMKKLLGEGVVGEIDIIIGGKGCPSLSGWLVNPDMGGGILLYLGVHLTDQVLWVSESKAKKVYAEVNFHTKYKVDETATYTIRFENDILATLNCSMVAGKSFDFLEIIGSEGYLRSEWRENKLTVYSRKVKEYSNPTTIQVQEELIKMYQLELQEFVNAISEHRDPSITGEDGQKVLEIIDSVFESGKTGTVVTLSD